MTKVTNQAGISTLPLHKQVTKIVRGWIVEGKYRAGDQLPTAKEISHICGVNEQTVRRALKRLMEEGLLRGAQGKGIFVSQTGAKHKRVALVLPNLEDEVTIMIAQGAQEVFEESGIHVLILDARRDAEKEEVNIANLSTLPVDGAIIFPIQYGNIAERILSLKVSGMPAVFVDKYLPGINFDYVVTDDFGGSYALIEALIKRGYRRITWLGGEEGSSSVEERLEGYRWAMGDNGLPVSRRQVARLALISPTADFHDRLAECVDGFLALPAEQKPQLITCANDLLALGVMAHLQKRGVRVPEDIAVAGYDGLKAAAASQPGLTTVQKPIKQMGAEAARLLLNRLMDKASKFQKVVLSTEPVLRASVLAKIQ